MPQSAEKNPMHKQTKHVVVAIELAETAGFSCVSEVD